MYLTWYGANTWLIEMANQRILLDPWFVGPLVFGGQSWFFKAEQAQTYEIPSDIDLILLSQGLPDHAHPPTLKVLDQHIPVVGSPNAAQVVRKLGYTNVQAIAPGESLTVDTLEINAFPGSPIGPTLIENAYILKGQKLEESGDSTSLYYEPHGFHSKDLKDQESVDVVITPLTNLTLPLVGSFINGGKAALKLARRLSPQILVPTTIGGDVQYSGLLNTLIKTEGTLATLQTELDQLEAKSQILSPPGTAIRFEVPLRTYELH